MQGWKSKDFHCILPTKLVLQPRGPWVKDLTMYLAVLTGPMSPHSTHSTANSSFKPTGYLFGTTLPNGSPGVLPLAKVDSSFFTQVDPCNSPKPIQNLDNTAYSKVVKNTKLHIVVKTSQVPFHPQVEVHMLNPESDSDTSTVEFSTDNSHHSNLAMPPTQVTTDSQHPLYSPVSMDDDDNTDDDDATVQHSDEDSTLHDCVGVVPAPHNHYHDYQALGISASSPLPLQLPT